MNRIVPAIGFAILLGTASLVQAQQPGGQRLVIASEPAAPSLLTCGADCASCGSSGYNCDGPHHPNYLLKYAKHATRFIMRWPKHCFAHPIGPPHGGTGYGYYEPQWRPFQASYVQPIPAETIEMDVEIIQTPIAP
ncbi:hypothetical protein [Blastopirellula retiformator]|uniref:Uncharacterized protein n=1 Tax=Blastopirellula retiformator TaxID=2527970 RepID=A0A5C5VAE9_9BACT|nr:hypothetical protein [Blastopirellula retiformator]TWT34625.1 hypothetical protein Enr8_20380 [Blastopirellula retiformator]